MGHRSRLSQILNLDRSLQETGQSDFELRNRTAAASLLIDDDHFDAEAPILHLTPKWSDSIDTDIRQEPLCHVYSVFQFAESGKQPLEAVIRIMLVGFRIPVQLGEPELNADNTMKTFGLERLGPGTWKVCPSVNLPELNFHAFVVLCNVPEPLPWQVPAPPECGGDERAI